MSKRYNRGLVPLSADPVTYGHINIITRAAQCCDHLTVLIGHNDLKRGSYLFTLAERIALTTRAVAHLNNVSVEACSSLLVDVFLRGNFDVVFRGIRNEQDRAYEVQQMRYSDLILPGFSDRVVYLEARPDLADVSSSAVKAFVSHHVDVSRFVPVLVKARLEEEICGYTLIGITGGIATGKTYVATQLAERLEGTHLNFDHLIRGLYIENSRGAQYVRDTLAGWFGPDVLCADGSEVDRKVLGARLFDPQCPADLRERVETLTTPHVFRLYREHLARAKGLVVVEWAQLAEMGLSHLVNHCVIVVESPDREIMYERRGISPERFAQITSHQWGTDRKVAELEAVVEQAGFGSVAVYENYLDPDKSARGLEHLAAHVRTTLGLKEAS